MGFYEAFPPAGASLANAVSDALGVEVKKLPLKPDYILQLVGEAASREKQTDK